MSAASTLIQATNLVLLLTETTADNRKFIIWRDNTEVLSGLQITKISFEDNAKVFEHPLETGAVVNDHIIYESKTAVIQAYIAYDDKETLQELETLYLSGAVLKIRVGSKVIDKAVIAGKPNEITGDVYDKSLYSIKFQEAQEVTPAYTKYTAPRRNASKMATGTTKKAGSASTVNTGVKQAKKSSWAYSLIHGERT